MNCLSIICAAALFFPFTDIAASQTTDSTYTLTGTIKGASTGWVYLLHAETKKLDSARVSNNKFVFSGTAAAPEFCMLGFSRPTGKKEFPVEFFLQSGDLQFSSKEAMGDAAITGGSVQEEFRQYQEKEKAATDKTQLAADYTKTHPSSYIAVFELANYFSYNPDTETLQGLYNGLDENIRSSYTGKAVRAMLDAAIMTGVGRPAPEFTQNDSKGKPVTLASFRGQYVLIDFWASWCGPCRAENPAVVKAYHAWHSKGFTILGISLDDNKESWLTAIKKDGLDWTQVSDLKSWQNSVATLYGIQGIPMNFLLDKDGKIIAKGLRGDDLEKKLAELVH
jgi:peroxiredoxin